MNIIGIIVEYNPLHNGHINHINKIKNKYPDSLIIAAMSGNVVQRGEFAIVSKFDRSIEAIINGIDIVVEIPSYFVLNSANFFAQKAIEILNDFKVERIIFGSEENDIEKLKNKSEEIKNITKDQFINSWSKNHSLPLTIEEILDFNFKSNDILGIAYLNEAEKINPNLILETIKRDKSENFESASKIRKLIIENKEYKQFIPNDWINTYKSKIINNNEFEKFFKYDLITKQFDQKIMKFMQNKINESYESNILKINSKNFTNARVKRELMKNSLQLEKTNYKKWRVLSTSEKGREYLNKNRKDLNYSTRFLPIYSNEFKIAKTLSLVYGEKIIINEINWHPQYSRKLIDKALKK